jgi:hypothetical protein
MSELLNNSCCLLTCRPAAAKRESVMGNMLASCLRPGGQARAPTQRPLSEVELAASLSPLPDDCMGEVYKWCPDGETKRNLRTCCKAFCHSPAINSYCTGAVGIAVRINSVEKSA